MKELEINCSSPASIKTGFKRIAERLFKDFFLQVNFSAYRLLDIEFYYYAKEVYEDVYAHQHEAQLKTGSWYFHGSGIDLTFGNGKNHGGILIRGIAKIGTGTADDYFIEKEIHGPLNVKTEICSNLQGAFQAGANIFQLHDISFDRMAALMKTPSHIIETKRIGLNLDKDNDQNFYDSRLRYVIFPHLKLRDKTQIAFDMRQQFPEMTTSEINSAMGSTFL